MIWIKVLVTLLTEGIDINNYQSGFSPAEGADGSKFLLILCLTGSQILPCLQFNEMYISLQLPSVGRKT